MNAKSVSAGQHDAGVHPTHYFTDGSSDVRPSTYLKLAAIVVAVVVIIQAGKIIASHISFGCGGASADTAHADSTDCPSYVSAAAADRGWAVDQQRVMKSMLTVGRYITNKSAIPVEIESGWNSPAGISDQIVGLLRTSPKFPNLGSGKPNVAGDVETKVAMVMRLGKMTSAVVAINHPLMCAGPVSCRVAVPAILPKGSVLYVWELGADRAIECDGEGTCH